MVGNDVRRANREGGLQAVRLRLVRQPPHAVRFAGRMSFRTNSERSDKGVLGGRRLLHGLGQGQGMTNSLIELICNALRYIT